MSAFFIFILTSSLLGLSMVTVLFILMQRPSEESGMGATLGGGAVTSIFGGEGVNTLARITKYCVALFFFLSLVLSLLHMALEKIDKPRNLLEKKEVTSAIAATGDRAKTTAPAEKNTIASATSSPENDGVPMATENVVTTSDD
jgi:preprotein translocase subunit SecG